MAGRHALAAGAVQGRQVICAYRAPRSALQLAEDQRHREHDRKFSRHDDDSTSDFIHEHSIAKAQGTGAHRCGRDRWVSEHAEEGSVHSPLSVLRGRCIRTRRDSA